jgi:DNA topoisomerase IA
MFLLSVGLINLIWKRTIASQMADAEIEKTVLQITNKDIKENLLHRERL